MSDNGIDLVSLQRAWRSFGGRIAVTAGSLVALISLFHHVPVWVASMRGALAWASVLTVARLGFAALARSVRADGEAVRRGEKARP